MAEQIITKTCRTCKQTKPISEFYRRTRSKDSYQTICINCEKTYDKTEKGKARFKRHRQTDKYKVTKKRYDQSIKGKSARSRYNQSEKGKNNSQARIKRYRSRNPEKEKARKAVRNAIKRGKLPRPDTFQCSCGEQAKDYHHHKGYAPEHWLDVIPVCKKCHNLIIRA